MYIAAICVKLLQFIYIAAICVNCCNLRILQINKFANKQISHLHPLNKADGSARSDSHSFSQDSRSTAEYT